MANYIALLQLTDQGIRNVKETTKRAASMTEMASRMGVKITDIFWTLGPYDGVIVAEAPDDETMTAFTLKSASFGNVKTLTLRAFRANEMDGILSKVK
ncbi:MAG TPA: GYD domain-containing protein [Verrucomicrobiae bacterium]|nr:GYD domain-containing protein [Verrucomicrobiae bacterium]